MMLEAMVHSTTAKHIVMGMPHRGRLNVMTGVFQKPAEEILREFAGKQGYFGTSDVKYHNGWSSEREVGGRKVKMDVLFNPSHLESVDAVVVGFAKGIAEECDMNTERVLPILVHGEAAVAGQGCVYELLCMSKLKGYEVGGIIHIVNDNQVGFTANGSETRSWPYASQVAKLCDSPIVHVNGDDPEAVYRAALQAVAFREKFGKSIFINMVSYRRFGHNEGDEPMFTQPLMYKRISGHKDVATLYGNSLVSLGVMSKAEMQKVREDYFSARQSEFEKVSAAEPVGKVGDLEPMDGFPRTAISTDHAKSLVQSLVDIPEDFAIHKNVERIVAFRKDFMEGKVQADWSVGEALAFASLLHDGHDVRISGQDSSRGTFSHRHAVLLDQENGSRFCIFDGFKGKFHSFNSPLSEEGVMAFEYGYSLIRKDSLSIWEAQFGDFANGAQLVIDEYLVSGEEKWNQCSNLTLLLPHSSDGQGPDHTSARIERFLQMCAKDNMRVVLSYHPVQFLSLVESPG